MDEALSLLGRVAPYALPPLLGAVIGYVTNALAIRMLFRPLAEKRVLGVRIPLTPGVIPRRRHQLSHSIARMVSTRLLTEDLIVGRLREPTFREALHRSVSRFTAEVLDGSGGDPASAVAEARTAVTGAAGTLIEGFLRSNAFRQAAQRLVAAALGGVMELPVDRLLPQPDRLERTARRVLSSLLTGPPGAAAAASVKSWVSLHVERDTRLRDLAGSSPLEQLADLLGHAYDPIFETLLSFLRHPVTRRELEVQGRDVLKSILSRLNALQRLIVSAAQYDRSLNQTMPEIVDDLIGSVERAGRNRAHKERIVAGLRSRIMGWGEIGVGTLARGLGLDLVELAGRATTSVLALLEREEVRAGVLEALGRFVDAHRDESVGGAIEKLSGLTPEEALERVRVAVDSFIDRPESLEHLSSWVTGFVVRYLGDARSRGLRSVLPLSEEQKHHVDTFLGERVADQLERRVPEIVAGLDVYGMVVAKIDALDVRSVEELLLMVIARHLKWINLFGALIGALIGAAQVVIGRLV